MNGRTPADRALHRQATVTVDEAASILVEHDRLDGWLNYAYRALKNDRDGGFNVSATIARRSRVRGRPPGRSRSLSPAIRFAWYRSRHAITVVGLAATTRHAEHCAPLNHAHLGKAAYGRIGGRAGST